MVRLGLLRFVRARELRLSPFLSERGKGDSVMPPHLGDDRMRPLATLDWNLARHRCAIIVPVLLGLLACDGVDVGKLASDGSKAFDTVAELTGAPREADMESIGPDAALRVFYQFVDDGGTVQFVERLTDVPAAWRDRVGYVEMSQAPPLTPAEARKSWVLSAARSKQITLAATPARPPPQAAGGRRMDEFENGSGDVILYSATWCGYCTKARQHLDSEGIDYEIRDVDNGAISRELREKTGRGGVPVLDFGGEVLRGYSADQYARAIRTIKKG